MKGLESSGSTGGDGREPNVCRLSGPADVEGLDLANGKGNDGGGLGEGAILGREGGTDTSADPDPDVDIFPFTVAVARVVVGTNEGENVFLIDIDGDLRICFNRSPTLGFCGGREVASVCPFEKLLFEDGSEYA